MLKISPQLQLPLEAVTSTFGVLAVRGAGKSNAARVMAEEMFAARLPFVYVDPVGSAYGLRSGGDGKSRGGLPIPIFGGKHGDVPLERGAGELIADLIVERRLSCVLDVSELDSEADKKAFLLAFARRLYKKNQDPLHLFLEEADDYIPQKPMRDEAQLLRAWENIVRRGRSRGIGCTIITQRSAAVNKMVLTQVETLFVMRTTGPQDRAAIEAWTKYHQVGTELLESLAGLEDGEAWAWSPHFLRAPAKRFRFRRCSTFDSGATPKNVRGREARRIATLADVDLEDLKGRIAETVERAKESDPKVLKAKIAELEKQLRAKPAPSAPARQPPVKVPVFDRRALDSFRKGFDARVIHLRRLFKDGMAAIDDLDARLGGELLEYIQRCEAAQALGEHGVSRVAEAPERRRAETILPPAPKTVRSSPIAESGVALRPVERKILAALKKYDQRSLSELAILIGSPLNSTMKNAASKLRTVEMVKGSNELLEITSLGSAEAGEVEPLPAAGEDLLKHWLEKLRPVEGELLKVWVSTYPQSASLEVAARSIGSDYNSTVKNAASKLRTLGLIIGKNDNAKANERLVG